MSMDPGLKRAYLSVAVSAALFVAVLVAGGVRSAGEKRMAQPTAPPAQEQSAAVFMTDRDALRREEMAALQEISADASAPQELRSEADRRRMQLMAWMEQEAAIESVLGARGFAVPVVTVHEDSVNVVVQAEALSRTEAGIILELVTRETGVTGGNVKIIPIN